MTAVFALAVGVGAAIKIAPGLLIPVAFAARRRAEAIAALGLGAVLGGAWLSWAGGDALNQVLSLRGVTGWHLESVPGSLLALFTDEAPRLEADAYRIGTVSDTVVLAGRLVTLAVVVRLGVLVNRRPAAIHAPALMMLGSTAALLVTAPLLSPQFLLWLTPPAALLWTSEVRSHRRIVWLTAIAIAITALTLVVFGPAGVGRPVAAAALLVRDGLLAMVVFGCMRAAQVGWNTRAGSTAPAHGQLVRSRRSTRWPR